MKMLIASTCAAFMIAASSMAFAADNKGKDDNGGNDPSTTGSVTNGPDTPTQFDIDRCKTAPADDKTCDPVRARMQE